LRYHGVEGSPYPLPNDKEEHRRLDQVLRYWAARNVLPPLSNPTNILDVGTGGGAWCIEVAHQYPGAVVTGIDISPIDREGVPENCNFIVANLNEGLKFEDNSMDFVHSRLTEY
jgi:ubiquinone/menaquinone biosynthesis C-methylase UbiE